MKKLLWRIFFVAILLAAGAAWFFYGQYTRSADPGWGLNFSLTHAQYLRYDWQKMYLTMLDELGPKRLRVMALWEVIEPKKDRFSFSETDFIVREAEKRNIKIILTLGYKQPGWPECHEPGWAQDLESRIKNQELLEFMEAVVERYKSSPAVAAWQVENEPFFVFGPDCPAAASDTFAREIALVKSLDSRPIVLTDSGEKGPWIPTARYGADIFGSTMYRQVYQDNWKMYVSYPIPPEFYHVKAGILKTFYPAVKSMIGVELQGEPWFISDVHDMPWEEQKKLMNGEILLDNAEYARRAGFAENYFWGVEWWYWAKEIKGDDELWEIAKRILSE